MTTPDVIKKKEDETVHKIAKEVAQEYLEFSARIESRIASEKSVEDHDG